MLFKFIADTVLEAESVDDCFTQLAAHFIDPSHSDLKHEGTLEIIPIEE